MSDKVYKKIREALESDLGAIVEIYNSAIPDRTATADLEPVSVFSQRSWFFSHNSATHPIWVIENPIEAVEPKDQILGWVSLQPFYGRVAYHKTAEVSIYIHPNYQNQGLGKLLLSHTIQASPNLGISTLLGFIFGHNLPSLKLFANLGFNQWGFLPKVAELDQVERDLAILGLRL
ncbi:sortase-like acyltransferase [Synechococcus sp. PCC 7502]|uniref:GNAT family N-acetyltransferase n=1 Tax=Synechococcus sp. PCC 7502 TaxID=1173263 RepID=UPI00029FC48D|nr:GNAT family N-acetyltransferase [Synechococcus sp. PCC 7502]AFY74122.1 sortase-like acyltransferase [Synechococcus sp. PCC 7502]